MVVLLGPSPLSWASFMVLSIDDMNRSVTLINKNISNNISNDISSEQRHQTSHITNHRILYMHSISYHSTAQHYVKPGIAPLLLLTESGSLHVLCPPLEEKQPPSP
jgi:hypothetical protein